jgi:hypothetical protein
MISKKVLTSVLWKCFLITIFSLLIGACSRGAVAATTHHRAPQKKNLGPAIRDSPWKTAKRPTHSTAFESRRVKTIPCRQASIIQPKCPKCAARVPPVRALLRRWAITVKHSRCLSTPESFSGRKLYALRSGQ